MNRAASGRPLSFVAMCGLGEPVKQHIKHQTDDGDAGTQPGEH